MHNTDTVQFSLKMKQTLIYVKKTEPNPLFTACENLHFITVQPLHGIGADIYFCQENNQSSRYSLEKRA